MFIRKDIDGKNVIRLPVVVFTVIITIIISIIPVVYSYGVLNEEVKTLKSVLPSYDSDIGNLEKRIVALEVIASSTDTSLGNIEDDISEIKTDLREIVKSIIEVKY